MNKRIKTLRPQELIKLLEKAGFIRRRQTGSHIIMVKPGKRSIPVPFHPKSLKRPLQLAILKQANLTTEDLEKLL